MRLLATACFLPALLGALAGCGDASPEVSPAVEITAPAAAVGSEASAADSTERAAGAASHANASPAEADAASDDASPADEAISPEPPPVLPAPPVREELGPIVCHIVPPRSLDEGMVTLTNRAPRPVTRLYVADCKAAEAQESSFEAAAEEVLSGRPVAPDSTVWLELDDGCYRIEPHSADGAGQRRTVRVDGPTTVALTLDAPERSSL